MRLIFLVLIPLCILFISCTRLIQPVLFDTTSLNTTAENEGLLAFMINKDVRPAIEVTVRNLTTGDRYKLDFNHKHTVSPLKLEAIDPETNTDSIPTISLAGLEIPLNTIDTTALRSAIYLYSLPSASYVFDYSDFTYSKSHRGKVSFSQSDTISIESNKIVSLGFVDIEFEERLFSSSTTYLVSTEESLQPILNLIGAENHKRFSIIDYQIDVRTDME